MSTTAKFPIEFNVIELATPYGNYQTLKIILEPQVLIKPSILEQLEFPLELDLNREVILSGSSPIWLYGYLVNRCKTASWVACHDINTNRVIVVQSRVKAHQVGDMMVINSDKPPGTAILIGGPPDSGKSVLSYALSQALRDQKYNLNVFLKRANWDGEGNWVVEMGDKSTAKQLKERNTYRLHQQENGEQLMSDFFQQQANNVKNIQDMKDAVLVDIGGKVQEHKLPILKQCSHYIIISSNSEKIQEWHNFFGQSLQPLAVIHSVLEDRLEIIKTDPFLEVIAGPWITGETVRFPDIILNRILQVIKMAQF
ncbi:MAG: CRISPR-associated ring nuclease Crn3/Csx3 [Microcoleaceae cyanobacterium]